MKAARACFSRCRCVACKHACKGVITCCVLDCPRDRSRPGYAHACVSVRAREPMHPFRVARDCARGKEEAAYAARRRRRQANPLSARAGTHARAGKQARATGACKQRPSAPEGRAPANSGPPRRRAGRLQTAALRASQREARACGDAPALSPSLPALSLSTIRERRRGRGAQRASDPKGSSHRMARMTGRKTRMSRKGNLDATEGKLGFDSDGPASLIVGPGLDRAYTEPCAAMWMTRLQTWTVLVLNCG
jgi:hypothetical protein